MGNLLEYAKSEMARADLYSEGTDYGPGSVAKCVEELVTVIEKQGHSGGSMHMVLGIFDRVVRFLPLTPLTSNPSEWMKVQDNTGDRPSVWQSTRQPAIFSHDGGKTGYSVDDPERVVVEFPEG